MKSFFWAKLRGRTALLVAALPLIFLVTLFAWQLYDSDANRLDFTLLVTAFSAFLALFSLSYSSLLSQSRASLEDCRELFSRLEAEIDGKSGWSPFIDSSPKKWRRIREILETIHRASGLIFQKNHVSLFRFYESHTLEKLKWAIPHANCELRYFTSRSPLMKANSDEAPSLSDIAAVYRAVFPERYSLREVVSSEGVTEEDLEFFREKEMMVVHNYLKSMRGHSVDT